MALSGGLELWNLDGEGFQFGFGFVAWIGVKFALGGYFMVVVRIGGEIVVQLSTWDVVAKSHVMQSFSFVWMLR